MKKSPRVSEDAVDAPNSVVEDRLPSGVACEGSFRLLGTPLGFAGARGASLEFLASMDGPLPKRGSRVLMSPLSAQAIDSTKRGLDALVLGYDRKIRLGRMDIRLLPSGYGPGSAQLEVAMRDKKILMVGGLRACQPLSAQSLEIPKCDLVLLDMECSEPKPPAPKRMAKQILDWTRSVIDSGKIPVLAASSRTAALETAWILRSREMPVKASRPLFDMLRRVGSFGYAMQRLRRLDQKIDPGDVVLLLSSSWPKERAAGLPNVVVAHVGAEKKLPSWSDMGFRLGESEDRRGIVNYVKNTEASIVALGPRCDQKLGQMLSKAGIKVYRVRRPSQTELPF